MHGFMHFCKLYMHSCFVVIYVMYKLHKMYNIVDIVDIVV